MSYQTIQTAVLTLTRAYSSGSVFTAATSAEDDWRVLDSGETLAAVVTQAGDTQEGYTIDGRGAHGKRFAKHQVGIMIASAIRTDNDAAALQTLYEAVEGVAAYLRRYPRLNNTTGVIHAVPGTRSRRRLIAPTNDETRSTHWSQMITIEVWEEITLSLLESGG